MVIVDSPRVLARDEHVGSPKRINGVPESFLLYTAQLLYVGC